MEIFQNKGREDLSKIWMCFGGKKFGNPSANLLRCSEAMGSYTRFPSLFAFFESM